MFGRFFREFILGPSYWIHRYLISKSRNKRYSLEVLKEPSVSTITTKDDIRRNPKKFLRKSFFVPLLKCRTGGTTGTPFIFYLNKLYSRQKERAYIFDIWGRIGYKPFDYRIIVRGNGTNKVFYNWFENALIIPQNYFIEQNRKELLRIFKTKEFYLHVYPSTLSVIIDFFGDEMFSTFRIKGVFAGSESFPPYQMEYYENKYNLKIAHWYGHSEYAILARYCPHCKEFHFYPTYGKVSLFGEGIEKEILATSYSKYGTVFRNYKTEDLAIVSNQKCDVDSYPKVSKIIGRSQEYIIDSYGNKRAFGPYLFGIHGEFWEMIKNIQFIQNEKGNISVNYIPYKIFNRVKFENFLKDRFANYNLDFNEVSEIKKTVSGKHRYFIQKINK